MASAAAASATGTARGTMQGSWRPWTESSAFSIASMSTVCCSRPMEGVGFTAMRHMTGAPVEMPPRMPPALLDSTSIWPVSASTFQLSQQKKDSEQRYQQQRRQCAHVEEQPPSHGGLGFFQFGKRKPGHGPSPSFSMTVFSMASLP